MRELRVRSHLSEPIIGVAILRGLAVMPAEVVVSPPTAAEAAHAALRTLARTLLTQPRLPRPLRLLLLCLPGTSSFIVVTEDCTRATHMLVLVALRVPRSP